LNNVGLLKILVPGENMKLKTLALTAILSIAAAACSKSEGTGIMRGSRMNKTEHIYILHLEGTDYEMGYQHGRLAHDILLDGADYIEKTYLGLLLPVARELGYLEDSYLNSYPGTFDECRGLVDAVADKSKWSMDMCMALNYGDAIVEFVLNPSEKGSCTQFAAKGAATRDGKLIHARNLDWDKIEYMMKYPTLIIRKPAGKIPYMCLGFPGNISPYSGMNAHGLSIASNEMTTYNDRDRVGRSHVQMVREILAECRNVEEAISFIKSQDHMTAEIFMISDPNSAVSVEMTANHIAVRPMNDNGLVYTTNHFVSPDMLAWGEANLPEESTTNRYIRLTQLIEPGVPESIYGRIDAPSAVSVLRDTFDVFNNVFLDRNAEGGTIANNGTVQSIVFIPGTLDFYVGVGMAPTAFNKFIGFNMNALLGLPGAHLPEPAEIP
jgi:hypothetical protein